MARKLLCWVLCAAATVWGTGVWANDLSKNIFVSEAWVQAMPPSQTTTAAYMTIANNSSKEIILVKATSDAAASVEIHQMSEANGMMKMAMVPEVRIPALSKVLFGPSGLHIMLINLKKPLNKGDVVPITLHFKDGAEISLKVPVQMQPQEDPSSSSMPSMKM